MSRSRPEARPSYNPRPGRVAQWESARFTRERSLVRNQPCPSRVVGTRPPEFFGAHVHLLQAQAHAQGESANDDYPEDGLATIPASISSGVTTNAITAAAIQTLLGGGHLSSPGQNNMPMSLPLPHELPVG